MTKEVSTIFTVGDVVTLKLNPEFRGVIEAFLAPTHGAHVESSHKIINNLQNSQFKARISFLDSNFKTEFVTVPILHLKHVG